MATVIAPTFKTDREKARSNLLGSEMRATKGNGHCNVVC